jgi:hypothetical protein
LGDGDLGAFHFGMGYGFKLGKWQPYTDFSIYNGTGANFTPGLVDDWLLNYAYEAGSERTPFLMYNNGWNARLGVLYKINADAKNSLEIGGGLNLTATNQIDLSSSLAINNDVVGFEGVDRISIPSVERYLDTGYHVQVAYFHRISEPLEVGFNINYQSSFDSYFGVYVYGGLNLRCSF